MSRNVTHKFTRANVDYCQDFLNYMSNVDPFRLKFLMKVVFPFMTVIRDTDIHRSILDALN